MDYLMYHNEKPFIVKRRIPIYNFAKKDEEVDLEFVKMWKEYIGCDHVLKDQSCYIFVNNIEEAEYEQD